MLKSPSFWRPSNFVVAAAGRAVAAAQHKQRVPVEVNAPALSLVRLPELMALGEGSADVRIGLVDGPVASDHPLLTSAQLVHVSRGPGHLYVSRLRARDFRCGHPRRGAEVRGPGDLSHVHRRGAAGLPRSAGARGHAAERHSG